MWVQEIPKVDKNMIKDLFYSEADIDDMYPEAEDEVLNATVPMTANGTGGGGEFGSEKGEVDSILRYDGTSQTRGVATRYMEQFPIHPVSSIIHCRYHSFCMFSRNATFCYSALKVGGE